MKASVRLKYMWTAFVDVLATLFGFIGQLIVPVLAAGGVILAFSLFPWWVGLIVCLTVALIIYLYVRAEHDYKEDYETSKDLLHDKYYNFTQAWFAKERGDQTCKAIYVQMTPLLDEFEALLEYHKKLYGEEDNYYKHYSDVMERFIKSRQLAEENGDRTEGGVEYI